MPLFHIHGLIGGAARVAGAPAPPWSASPGFDAFKFFGWLDETKPTWYTAVPTMHQLVLSRAGRQKETRRAQPSCASSAPPPPRCRRRSWRSSKQTFGAPVIEAYGMTEASHQMATNPLPPAARKPGSVGLGAGVEVAIMDDDGNLLLDAPASARS